MKRWGILWMGILLLSLFSCERPGGRTFYLDAENGLDANSGTSPDKAWQTLKKVSTHPFHAGDRVLLKSGPVYKGTLLLTGIHGKPEAPVIVSGYGGSAVIQSGDSVAVYAEDCSHISFSHLKLEGSGRLQGNKSDGLHLQGVRFGSVDSVEVSGYLFSGIHMKGGSDLRISHVYAHDNGFCGIYGESGESEYGADGSKFKTMHRIYIGHSVAFNNPGCPVIKDNHSGSGILLGGVVKGIIEYCEAMNNGWDMPREGNGPVGIWAYMSDSIIIQYCYSHHNKTSPLGKDGGGFDFDGGMRYSLMQYNLSAYNEGGGYGIFQYAGATEWIDNLIRYNISYNDGSKNSGAGIFMWEDPVALPMTGFHAYNNTIVSRYGPGIYFEPGEYRDFLFENNMVVLTGRCIPFTGGDFTGAVFNNNLWWSVGCAGQRLPQPITADKRALLAEPGLVLPEDSLANVLPGNLETLPWFRLLPGSPGRQSGIPVGDAVNDLWNNRILGSGKCNMGAWQGD